MLNAIVTPGCYRAGIWCELGGRFGGGGVDGLTGGGGGGRRDSGREEGDVDLGAAGGEAPWCGRRQIWGRRRLHPALHGQPPPSSEGREGRSCSGGGGGGLTGGGGGGRRDGGREEGWPL